MQWLYFHLLKCIILLVYWVLSSYILLLYVLKSRKVALNRPNSYKPWRQMRNVFQSLGTQLGFYKYLLKYVTTCTLDVIWVPKNYRILGWERMLGVTSDLCPSFYSLKLVALKLYNERLRPHTQLLWLRFPFTSLKWFKLCVGQLTHHKILVSHHAPCYTEEMHVRHGSAQSGCPHLWGVWQQMQRVLCSSQEVMLMLPPNDQEFDGWILEKRVKVRGVKAHSRQKD